MEKSREADDLMRNMTESNPQMNILFDDNFSVSCATKKARETKREKARGRRISAREKG